jgi:hypothetical protein
LGAQCEQPRLVRGQGQLSGRHGSGRHGSGRLGASG